MLHSLDVTIQHLDIGVRCTENACNSVIRWPRSMNTCCTGEHRAAAEAELRGVVTKQFSTRHCAIPTTGLIALVRSVPSVSPPSIDCTRLCMEQMSG